MTVKRNFTILTYTEVINNTLHVRGHCEYDLMMIIVLHRGRNISGCSFEIPSTRDVNQKIHREQHGLRRICTGY
jgi:hypothetical protein